MHRHITQSLSQGRVLPACRLLRMHPAFSVYSTTFNNTIELSSVTRQALFPSITGTRSYRSDGFGGFGGGGGGRRFGGRDGGRGRGRGRDGRDGGSRNWSFDGERRGNRDFQDRDRPRRRYNDDNDLEFTRKDVPEEQLFESATNTGINFEKYHDIPVEVKGKDTPAPIETFQDADLHPWLMRNLERAKYTSPTPVQKYGLPVVLSGRDMMACAQTGSGKTAGFLFPMIDLLLKRAITEQKASQFQDERRQRGYSKSEFGDFGYPNTLTAKPLALILAPTRELCLQLYDEARKFTYHTPIKTVALFGGSSINAQVSQLQRGCHIVVATPGRLSDMIERRMITMKDIRFLVLDEADRMLDMGFEPQIRRIVDEEKMPPAGERQTLMYSATFPSEIQSLAASFLDNYVFLTVGRVGSTSENINQTILHVEEEEKRTKLLELVRETTSKGGLSLVFVGRKSTADYLEGVLVDNGIRAISIHGDKSQRRRDVALNSFKNGDMQVLVATEVAARGLDIGNVQHVINVDLPENIDSYVHRIGRTGRAGNIGDATSFFNMDVNPGMTKDLIKILEESNSEVPTFLYDAISRPSFQSTRRGGRGSRGSRGGRGSRGFGGRGGRDSFSFRRSSFGGDSYARY